MQKRVVVYTANFNGKDIIEKNAQEEGVRYVCYTNSPNLVDDTWEKILIPQFMSTPRMTSRFFKAVPHLFFSNYEYSIWIDGRVVLTRPVNEYLNFGNIASTKHPNRECIYDESEVVIEKELDLKNKVLYLMKQYNNENYPPKNGLHETCIVVRKNTEEINKFNKSWLKMITSLSIRDQLSFDYLLWTYNLLPVTDIPTNFITKKGHNHAK